MIFDKIFGGKKEEKKNKEVEKIKLAVDRKKENNAISSISNTNLIQQNNQNSVISNVNNANNSNVNISPNVQSNPIQNIQQQNTNISPNANTIPTPTNQPNSLSSSNQLSPTVVQKPEPSNLTVNIQSSQSTATQPQISPISQSPTNDNQLNLNIPKKESEIGLNKLNEDIDALILNEIKKEEKEEKKKGESELIFGGETEEHQKTKEEEEELFIRLDKYEEIIKTIKEIKDKINENEMILEKIINIKKEEDAKLNKWESELRTIYDKIRIIENNLKNTR